MGKIKYTKELLEPIVKRNINMVGVVADLGLSYSNGSNTGISQAIIKYNIDTSHFIFGNLGRIKKRYTDDELFSICDKDQRSIVRKRIIDKNLIPYICSECKCSNEWRGKKMPLILDHINGINNDNRLGNLRFLCPNCDSIQDTYKSKNKNTSKGKISIRRKIEKENKKFENKNLIIEKRNNIINLIKNSNIDFTKTGWRLEVGILIGKVPQYAGNFVKKYIPELWNNCFKHMDRK